MDLYLIHIIHFTIYNYHLHREGNIASWELIQKSQYKHKGLSWGIIDHLSPSRRSVARSSKSIDPPLFPRQMRGMVPQTGQEREPSSHLWSHLQLCQRFQRHRAGQPVGADGGCVPQGGRGLVLNSPCGGHVQNQTRTFDQISNSVDEEILRLCLGKYILVNKVIFPNGGDILFIKCLFMGYVLSYEK